MRLIRRTALISLGVLVGGLGGWMLRGENLTELPRRSSTTSPGAETSVPSPAPNASETILSFYGRDSAAPRRFPRCNGVFTLCLGVPLDDVYRLLGREEFKNRLRNGFVAREWTLDAVNLGIDTNDARKVVAISVVARQGKPSDPVGLAVPNGLILGESKMGDVITKRGDPRGTELMWGADSPHYSYIYLDGKDESESVEFTYTPPPFPGWEDPGGFNDRLKRQPITSFTVRY